MITQRIHPITREPIEHALDVQPDNRKRCRSTIRLHGLEYRCARTGPHEGIHDADMHCPTDAGLVRW